MHDIGRTQTELENELIPELGFEGNAQFQEAEAYENELIPEMEYEGEGESLFQEVQELELASELMEVSNEAELDRFLGSLLGAAKGILGNMMSNDGESAQEQFFSWKKLGDTLKKVAKVALPVVGGIAGTALGGPLAGSIGGKLGSMAGNLFEMEMEGMSQEDREFETARRFIRLAGATARNANKLARSGVNPTRVVAAALAKAAKRNAPGLLTMAARRRAIRNRVARPGVANANGRRPNRPSQPNAFRPRIRTGSNGYAEPGIAYGPDAPDVGLDAYPVDGNGASPIPNGAGQTGTWARRGNTIVIYGA